MSRLHKFVVIAAVVSRSECLTSPLSQPAASLLPRSDLLVFDGLIVDASCRGPLHDGDRAHPRATWLLDAFEAAGKPVVFAVDGVCDESIEAAALARVGLLDAAEPFVPLRARLWPRTREERRAAADARAPAVVGAMAAAALGRAVVDDGGRNLEASAVSPELGEQLRRVFAPVGRRCGLVAAGTGDAIRLLDVLRSRPAAFRAAARGDAWREACSCVVATGGDAIWDAAPGGDEGFVSLSEFEELRGEAAVDAFLEAELRAMAELGVPMLAFDGEHRQLDRRGVAALARLYRSLGGEAEEVGFLGDDALLLRCAVDELARRGARRDRLVMLSTRDRPCRAAEWYGLATAFLEDGAGFEPALGAGANV